MSKPKPKKPEKKREEKLEVTRDLAYRTVINIEEYIRRLKNDIEKNQVKYHTPYTLAQTYGVKIGDARKILREAVKLGLMKQYSGGRRSPVYIPVAK